MRWVRIRISSSRRRGVRDWPQDTVRKADETRRKLRPGKTKNEQGKRKGKKRSSSAITMSAPLLIPPIKKEQGKANGSNASSGQ
jgi:hypothetical protein